MLRRRCAHPASINIDWISNLAQLYMSEVGFGIIDVQLMANLRESEGRPTGSARFSHDCKKMRYLTAALFLLLQGCGIFPCVDSQFTREPKSIDKQFEVVLTIDGKRTNKTISCEEYYDAMCAERGNFWSMREVGTASMNEKSVLAVQHKALGKIEVPVPGCASMVSGKLPPLEHTVLTIADEHYWLVDSNDRRKTYSDGKDPLKDMALDLNLSVNGTSLVYNPDRK